MKKLTTLLFVSVLLLLTTDTCAQKNRDSLVSLQIRQLYRQQGGLTFPQTVARFYHKLNDRPAWTSSRKNQDATWKAMLVLDCVLQFGLSHSDYHPAQLRYGILHDILEKPGLVSDRDQARFDVLLTDAMITLINHLHYGKLNPDFGQVRLDVGLGIPLAAEDALLKMLNGPDLFDGIYGVQPKSQAYAAMQTWMQKWKGQYEGDCYEVPEADVRRVAINMERLRWADINDSVAYVLVNIPAFRLTYHLSDTDLVFKVAVGKPGNPTPTLQSQINYLTTAPEWQVPNKLFVEELLPNALKNPDYLKNYKYQLYDREGMLAQVDQELLKAIARHPAGYYARQASGCDNTLGMVVFRFVNRYDVYLQDTPDQQSFSRTERALSNGCIRVQDAAGLATLLLQQDHQLGAIKLLKNAIHKQKRHHFILNKAVPVKITYLTGEIKEGELVNHPDIYQFDKGLETAFYQSSAPLVKH